MWDYSKGALEQVDLRTVRAYSKAALESVSGLPEKARQNMEQNVGKEVD